MEKLTFNGSLQVIYGKKSKRVTLQRSLVSLIAYYPEKVTLKHLVCLYDNMLWLQDKSMQDPDFREKFGVTLKVLAYILKGLNLSRGVSVNQIRNLSEKIQTNLSHFTLEKRNLTQPLKQQWHLIEIRPTKSSGLSNKLLPPQNYIGVGYRDKGTAKKPHFDGSPSWQEVASSTIKELSK